jgi:hypothetical protein
MRAGQIRVIKWEEVGGTCDLIGKRGRNTCDSFRSRETTEGGGLAVKSVVPSGLGCGGPRFESCNGKRLRLNPTIPTLDPLVPSWGWDNSYGSPVPSGPSG